MLFHRRVNRILRNSSLVFTAFFFVCILIQKRIKNNRTIDVDKTTQNDILPGKFTGLFGWDTTPSVISNNDAIPLQQMAKMARDLETNDMRDVFPSFTEEQMDEKVLKFGDNWYEKSHDVKLNLTAISLEMKERYARLIDRQNTVLTLFLMHTHLSKHVTKFIMDYFQYNSATYSNVTWCDNQPWKKPPFLDHVCERPAAVIQQTPLQIKHELASDHCQGIRMMHDFSLLDVHLLGFRNDFDLILIVQDPMQRVLDSYEMFPYKNKFSLKDFVNTLSDNKDFAKYTAHNLQTKQLAGVLRQCSHYSTYRQQNIERDLIETAKRNLETFDAIFLVDHLTESINYFENKYKWKSGDKNVAALVSDLRAANSKMIINQKVSEKDREIIQKAHYLDLELYDFVIHMFLNQSGWENTFRKPKSLQVLFEYR